MVLNISTWKKFYIKDLFEVTRGKRIVKDRDYIESKDNKNIYSVITAKTTNNGIDGYYSKWNCEGNVIVCGGEASGMISFYQEDKCWVMDRSRILKPKFNNLNKFVALFLIPMLNKWSIKFSYGNSANPDDIKKLYLVLPVGHNGSPDWEYMENYVKNLIEKDNLEISDLSKSLKNGHHELKIPTWKEFKINNIFQQKNIKKQSKTPNTFGNVPFVTSQSTNNGIKTYVSNKNIEIYPKNCITVSTNGNCFDCFYHNYEIVASTDVEVLYSSHLNKYNALFLITILNKQSKKYDYGRKPKNGIVWKTIIKLPIDEKGDPDWEYMENYIKSLPYSKYI